jgi:peptidase M28-like protein
MTGTWMRSLALPVCLLLAGLLAWMSSSSPETLGPDAPPTAFSSGRAYGHVSAIAERPHPLGSAENTAVREYVMRQFAILGLEVAEHPGHAIEPYVRKGETWLAGGDVINIVAVLPGRDRSLPALAVMSHYDAAPGSPGAADDAAGVASALEIARALKAQRQPERDVIFLVTDGEEAGLLGARAFFDSDPMARRVGAVLNMEARGGGGRVFMFQTAPNNGGWIDLFRRTAVNPSSNSLAVFLYSLMPNDTDFTVSMAHGKPGLNYAFIGRQFDYHSPSSTPANLDRGSLQHMGEQVLSAARGVAGARTLPAPAPDAVYADVLGGSVIGYPAWAGWIVLVLGVAMIAAAVWKVWPKRRRWPWRDFAAGVGAGLYLLLTCVALFELIRRGTGTPFGFFSQRPLLARFGLFELSLAIGALGVCLIVFHGLRAGRMRIAAAVFAAVVGLAAGLIGGIAPIPLVAGGVAALLGLVVFKRALHPWWVWFGFLFLAMLMALALQILAPGAAFLVQWPLIAAGALLLIIQHLGKGAADSPASLIAAVLIGAAGLGWLLYLGHGVAIGVGADLPAAPALFVLLATLVLFPLLYAVDVARIAGAAALVIVVGLVLFMRFVDPSSPRHPRVTHAVFVAEPDANRFWRASMLRHPDAWTKAVLTADGGSVTAGGLDPVLRSGAYATAKPIAIQKPYAAMTREPTGRVVVRLDLTPDARDLVLWLRSPQPMDSIRVNGIPVKLSTKPGGWTRIDWRGPRGGLEVVTTPGPTGSLEARWGVVSDGWPKDAAPLPARPVDAAAWDNSDSTAVIGTLKQSW